MMFILEIEKVNQVQFFVYLDDQIPIMVFARSHDATKTSAKVSLRDVCHLFVISET